VHQAFGQSLAKELIKTYDGSNLISDSQQDLIGERYLAEQIRLIQEQQRTTSILDKWSHLLYEGENEYKIPYENQKALHEIRTVSKGGSSSHFSTSHQNNKSLFENASNSFQSRLLEGETISSLNSNQRFLTQILDATKSGIALYANGQSQSGIISDFTNQFSTEIQPRTLSQEKQLEPQYEYEKQLREITQLRAIEEARQLVNAMSSTNSQLKKNIDQNNLLKEFDQHSIYQPSADQQSIYEQSVGQHAKYQAIANYDESNHTTENILQEESMREDIAHPKTSTHSFKYSTNKFNLAGSNLSQITSSKINKLSIEDYNTPQFKSMLDQILKPIFLPPEHLNCPVDWPSQDKIGNINE
jgi:hypothetical protein